MQVTTLHFRYDTLIQSAKMNQSVSITKGLNGDGIRI